MTPGTVQPAVMWDNSAALIGGFDKRNQRSSNFAPWARSMGCRSVAMMMRSELVGFSKV
jgi:hypothetical protein